MSRYVLCCVLLLFLAACSSVTETQGERVAASGDVLIGKPVTHANLAVFPLYLKDFKEVGANYITLEEALKTKKVEVKEKGEGGTVNCVVIGNNSNQSLYILAGQVITGGKQDRVITRDTIVPPGQKMQVEVCCVEQGRWTPRTAARTQAAATFSAAAGSRSQGSMNFACQALGKEAQGEVWEEVAKAADKLKAQTSTGTYKEVVEKTEKDVDKFLAALSAVFGKDRKICGFVTCVNGKVEACDLFASPALLAKFMESVLRSYALDALYAGEAKDAKRAKVNEVKSFVDEMLTAQKDAKTLDENKHRRVKKAETERVILFDNGVKNARGDFELLHNNAYSKKK